MKTHTLINRLWTVIGNGDLPHWNRPDSVSSYLAGCEDTLARIWNLIEQDGELPAGVQLSPIYTTPPDDMASDFFRPTSMPELREDLISLVRTQRRTQQEGAWEGFSDIASIQPSLSLRISRRVHRLAVQTALAAPREQIGALPIGSASIQTLIILNNLICLNRINEALPDEVRWGLRFIVRNYLKQKQELRYEIDASLKRLEKDRGVIETGDLVFLDSLTPFIKSIMKHEYLRAFSDRLIALSPLSLMRYLTDDLLWERATESNLAGVEQLFDHHCPFQFTGPVVQRWVDILLASPDQEKLRAFDRIERIISYLTSDRPASSHLSVPAIQTGRYCFQTFVRVLCRSWPDEERQEALFEQSPEESAAWYDILTRIQHHVDRVERSGLAVSPFIPAPERRRLEYALVLAQRKMAPVAAS